MPALLGRDLGFVLAADFQGAPGRTLWDHAERDRFRIAYAGGAFLEVDFAGRSDAFDVPSVRRQVQIGLENFGFVVMALQLERAQDLLCFPAKRAGMQMKSQPRQLHRDRGCAGVPAAEASQAESGAQNRNGIYAGMLREMFVFEAEGSIDQRGRDFAQRRPDSIFLIGRQRDLENRALAIANALRECDAVEQRRLRQREPGNSGQQRGYEN